jgi:hypothetical protein
VCEESVLRFVTFFDFKASQIKRLVLKYLDKKTEEIYHLAAPGRQGNGGQLFLLFLHSRIRKLLWRKFA